MRVARSHSDAAAVEGIKNIVRNNSDWEEGVVHPMDTVADANRQRTGDEGESVGTGYLDCHLVLDRRGSGRDGITCQGDEGNCNQEESYERGVIVAGFALCHSSKNRA